MMHGKQNVKLRISGTSFHLIDYTVFGVACMTVLYVVNAQAYKLRLIISQDKHIPLCESYLWYKHNMHMTDNFDS